jgi:hypothetical protein
MDPGQYPGDARAIARIGLRSLEPRARYCEPTITDTSRPVPRLMEAGFVTRKESEVIGTGRHDRAGQ